MKSFSHMLASSTELPFDSDEWLFEIKWDGYRAFATKNALMSRSRKISFNQRYPAIFKAIQKLPGKFLIDGEIVILDAKGRANFQFLQNYQKTQQGTPYYYVFDILFLNGKDLTHLPLIERKNILKALLPKSGPIRFSEHVLGKGKAFFREIKKLGLEGMIAKKTESTYQFGRSKNWLKIKTGRRQEVVIGGFTEPKGSRKKFGALLVGVYEKGKFVYTGHVGGGLKGEVLDEVYALLQKDISNKCPFFEEPHPNNPVTWVKPKLVCEVAFAEWTQDGMMRQPIFKGMRIDKSPKEVVRE